LSKQSFIDAHDRQAADHDGSLHPAGVEEHSASEVTGVPLLELSEVSANYGYTRALENLSLKIWPGQFVAVVGPNGGGKTTLLRTLLKMVPVTQGEILMCGEELRKSSLDRIGYVPQLETIDWNFPITVEEVISMGF
jgi:zinc/manganese transport system ATP-binding protein